MPRHLRALDERDHDIFIGEQLEDAAAEKEAAELAGRPVPSWEGYDPARDDRNGWNMADPYDRLEREGGHL